MLTNFGKFCRKLRIENSMLLLQMAEQLGVTSAFLSRVETGKAKPPLKWKEIIENEYELTSEQLEELNVTFYEAVNSDSISMREFDDNQKDLMLSFARKINTLDKKRLGEIKKLLD